MAINLAGGRGGAGYERCHTAATVDLRAGPEGPSGGPVGTEVASDLALRAIEQAVRSGDRVCPFGTRRVAVAFGPDADSVSPKSLGERLARAIRRGAIRDSERIGPHAPVRDRADGAIVPVLAPVPSAATITVDRMPARGGLRRRTVVRCSSGSFTRYGTRHDDIVPGDRGTILVVSPSRTSGGVPGLSAMAATAMAERLGYDVGTVALSCDDEILLEVRGAPVDLVLLVVEGEREPTSDKTTWASSTWHIPAQLAAKFGAQGIDVLAVGAGGGAGALASCVAQGAGVVADLDELRTELAGSDASEREETWANGGRVPTRMEALVILTASERRVLFYLTTGRSAQEIAEDLVVSVTTVRSHIRSILRKLGVRSQLAAVAIANSRDFGSDDAAPDYRELATPGVG